jgi:hypothetical protein
MKKEFAKKLLEEYIANNIRFREIGNVLPLTDEIVCRRCVLENDVYCIEEYTFIGLIKIAYDL